MVADAVVEVFKHCGGPVVPEQLAMPPKSWRIPFKQMAEENLLPISFDDAFHLLTKFYADVYARIN